MHDANSAASLAGVRLEYNDMNVIIKPGKLNGTVKVPPSKSYAHRMLLGAGLSCLFQPAGRSESCSVLGISDSEDMLATMDCLKALGLRLKKEGEKVLLSGSGNTDPDRTCLPVFPCRESGSTLRFMIPIALAVCGGGVFTGTPRLMERGIGIYEELFAGRGIVVEKTPHSLSVRGTLSAGDFRIRGDVSSQFITGMLFALALQKKDSTLQVLPPVESRSYINITLDVLKQFGISIREEEENVFTVPGGQIFRPGDYTVEGDWSNAAFLYALKVLGHELEIEGLKEDSIQGDRACVSFLKQLKGGSSALHQTGIDLSDTPDLGPVLFAAAAALRGGHFTGTKRLRIKESDRAEAMAEELSKFSVRCLVEENEVTVLQSPPADCLETHPLQSPDPSLAGAFPVPACGALKKPAVLLKGHNDHRIVMSLSVLATLTGAEIEGAEAVAKSWPGFFECLGKAGLNWIIRE